MTYMPEKQLADYNTLVSAKCFNRGHLGGFKCRIDPEEQTNEQGQALRERILAR